jgi:hypothetical protein
MNQDDIMRIAREAGATVSSFHGRFVMHRDDIERFFAAAYAAGAAEEREKWIKALDAEMMSCHLGVFNAEDDPRATLAKLLAWHQDVALDPVVSSGAQNLILEEREACAELCESLGGNEYEYEEVYPWVFASEIRARGDK